MNKVFEKYKTEVILFIILVLILVGSFAYHKIQDKTFNDKDLVIIEDFEEINFVYSENEYRVISMDIVDLINLYHKDFVYELATNPEGTWDKLTKSAQLSYQNKDEYVKYVKSIITKNTKSSTIVSYKNVTTDIRNVYEILDSEDLRITIEDQGIWRYKVSFIKKV